MCYYIKTCSLLGLTTTQIHQKLVTLYGQKSVEDDLHSGLPMTVVTQDNVAAVKDLVDDNPYISIDYIGDVLGISHGSVHTILREHLRLRK